MTAIVRRAEPGDAEAIIALIDALSAFVESPPTRLTADDIRRDGFGPDAWFQCFIAEQDCRPVGYAICYFGFSTDHGGRGLHLADLYVDPGQRGSGLGRAKALASLAGLLAAWFARALTEQAAREVASTTPRPRTGADLLARFQALVERDYRAPRSLSAYARELGVTPTHLSRVARGLTGFSASRLILERRLLEARRALAYTSLQIAEIAYMLGYSDPAYFARVFARAAGESPSAFRARLTAL